MSLSRLALRLQARRTCLRLFSTTPRPLISAVSDQPISDTKLPKKVPERREAPGAHIAAPGLFSLRGTTTVITGAGRGLGQRLAKGVIESGGSAACLDILTEPTNEHGEWDEIQQLARSQGCEASYRVCNITREQEMSDALAAIEKEGKDTLRGVVAAAGIIQLIPAVEQSLDDFQRIFDVNVKGVFVTAKAAANFWRSRELNGNMVLVASMSGQIANRGLYCTAYNSSKAAVQQMVRSVAQEWGEFGIRVNSLSPGYIRTAMTDYLISQRPDVGDVWMRGALLGRFGAPEDFVGPVIFLLSDASAFMTGADLRVDGGHCASA